MESGMWGRRTSRITLRFIPLGYLATGGPRYEFIYGYRDLGVQWAATSPPAPAHPSSRGTLNPKIPYAAESARVSDFAAPR